MFLGGFSGIGPIWGGMYSYQVSHEATRTAHRGLSRTRRLQEELRRVEDKLDKLTLVCMSMWSLLCEKTDLTEEQLAERVQQIDLQDGKADGKVTQSLKECPQCGRAMSSRHARCLYCGTEKTGSGAFGL
ncbi:MAG: hypothetical protein ACOC9S_02605 [Planctomycetota bacterium]